jgi:hypothetical protein
LEKKIKLRQFWVFLPENLTTLISQGIKKNTKFRVISISISGDTEVLIIGKIKNSICKNIMMIDRSQLAQIIDNAV